MNPENYKYNFKYRIEGTHDQWYVKRRNLFGFWTRVSDYLESQKAAYFFVEVLEAQEKHKYDV
jgi:hypothetical protein